jgi:Tfp pilus assembly protein PilF
MRFVVRYQLFIHIMIIIAFLSMYPAYSETIHSNPYLDLGIFAFEENDYTSALAHLKRAMLNQPNNALVYHYLAKTYQKMNRFKEARQYYERACEINKNLEDLLFDRGYFNYVTQKYQYALNDFVQAIKQTPDNLMAQYFAGICAFKLNQFETALQYFLSSTRQNTNIKTNCEYYAAVCYFQIGKPAQAQELFNKIFLSPESTPLRKDAKKWLEILKSNPSMFRPYHLFCDITTTYDTNLKLVSSSEDTNDKDDLLIKTFVNGKYNFVQSPIYIMGIEYNHFQSNHIDFSNYNIVGSAGSFYIITNQHNTTHSFYLRPEHIWLDNASYSSNQGLEYDIQWQKNQYLKLSANFEYAIYNNFSSNYYDGQAINFDFGMERTFKDHENLSLLMGIAILNKNTQGDDKKYQYGKFGCLLKFQDKQLKWLVGGSYSVRHYMHEDISFQKRREDNLTQLLTQFSLIDYTIQPVFQIEHLVNCSTINAYDYKRTAISISLRYFY